MYLNVRFSQYKTCMSQEKLLKVAATYGVTFDGCGEIL